MNIHFATFIEAKKKKIVQNLFVRKCFFFYLNSTFNFPTGNQYNDRDEQIDTKSDQWFGATVSSAGIDGPVVVSNLYVLFFNCIHFHILMFQGHLNWWNKSFVCRLFALQLSDTWYFCLFCVSGIENEIKIQFRSSRIYSF